MISVPNSTRKLLKNKKHLVGPKWAKLSPPNPSYDCRSYNCLQILATRCRILAAITGSLPATSHGRRRISVMYMFFYLKNESFMFRERERENKSICTDVLRLNSGEFGGFQMPAVAALR